MRPERQLVQTKMVEDMAKELGTPEHYAGVVEPIDLIESLGWGEAFAKASIIKYISRSGRAADELADLKKVRWFIDWLIEKKEPTVVHNYAAMKGA